MSVQPEIIERRAPDLVAVKGDKEKAAEYKAEMARLLTPICELFTKARTEALTLQFTIQFDAMGKFFVADIKAIKEL